MELTWGTAAIWLGLALVASLLSIRFKMSVAPRFVAWFLNRFSSHVSEPGVKFIFFVLFTLGALAALANSEAVLPAYLVGLGLAGVFARHRDTVRRLRTTVFALLTPFYFLNAGMKVYLPALWVGLGLVVILLAVKIATKVVGVWPLTRFFGFAVREGNYTTLLMSTGLTFGTISALFGLNNGYINQYQYSILVTVVIGSAIVPTMIAQSFFLPEIELPVAFQTGSPATLDPPSGKPEDGLVPAPPPKES